MPFHIGADSGQGRSSGGLSVGGDAVGLPTGVLCFRAAFFIALAVDFSVAGRAAVGFSSGANATKTDAGGCDAPATTTPSNRMREGMSHMPRNRASFGSKRLSTDSKQKCKARSSTDRKLWNPDKYESQSAPVRDILKRA